MNNQPKRTLPLRPHLDHLRAEAKSLLKSWQSGESEPPSDPKLTLAQYVVATQYGFESWPKLHAHVEQLTLERLDPAAWLKLAADPPLKKPHPQHKSDWWLALAAGDAESVERFLATHDANASGGPIDRYPLHYVCCLRVETIDIIRTVEMLLNAGADPNATYIDPAYPGDPLSVLWGACGIKNDIEVARMLLTAGANPNDNESLYHTVEHDNIELLQLLIDHGVDANGYNGLAHALDYERLPQVRMLLENGADPNGTTVGETAIHHAIRRGRSAKFMELLLEFGADLSKKSKDGLSVASHAALRGAPGVYEWAISHTNEELNEVETYISEVRRGGTQLNPEIVSQFTSTHLSLPCQAIMTGEIDQAIRMLKSGWPINSPDDGSATGSRGASPLHCACYVGNEPLVNLIIELGADVDFIEPHYKAPPMGWAIHGATFGHAGRGDHPACIRALRRAGAKIDESMKSHFSEEIEEAVYGPLD